MNKIKKLWKENKITVLFVIVIILILLVLFLMVFPLYSKKSGSDYGNRLDGIKEVAIKDSVNNEIEEYFKSTGKTKSVSTNLKGKLYNINITVNEGIDVNEIADISNDSLSKFSEKQLKFYDIQIFIKTDNEENPRSIVGYKNKNTDTFIWTNNK